MPTPVDVALARELVTLMQDEFTGRIKQFEFKYDTHVDLENMPDSTQAWISPNYVQRDLQTRGLFTKRTSLFVVLFVEQAETYDAEFMDAWLSDFDTLIDLATELRPLGNRVISVAQEARYNVELLHSYKRLVIDTELVYNII